MLKVQVLYKLSMYETDWTMTEEEYSEFIASTQGLPRPMIQKSDPVPLEDIPWHGAKTPSLVKDQEIAKLKADVDNLTNLSNEFEVELKERSKIIDQSNERYLRVKEDRRSLFEKVKSLEKELEAMTLKAQGMLEKPYWKDFPETSVVMDEPGTKVIAPDLKEFLDQPAWQPKDPRDEESQEEGIRGELIKPPPCGPGLILDHSGTRVIVPETLEIVPIVPEKVQKTPEKVQDKPKKTFSKYIALMDTGVPSSEIIKVMAEDFDVSTATARTYYYSKVTKRAGEDFKKPAGVDYQVYIDMLLSGKSENQVKTEMKKMLTESEIGKNYTQRVYTPYKVQKLVNVKGEEPKYPVTIIESKHSKLPRNLSEEIAALPNYENVREFKDVCITREYCNLYDIATLKANYKESHKEIVW